MGYFGEGIILEATARGLGTCWVGGCFHPEVVISLLDIENNERVYAVSPLGYPVESFTAEENRMRSFIKAHKRLPLTELVTGLSPEQWPEWLEGTLEGARMAPSAHNNQPWEFGVSQDAITISVNEQRGKLQQFNRLDCGIALLHIQLGAHNAGINGDFRFLKDPDVAVFNINNPHR
ncbi:MAG: nitroreductase family protein [Dehalogenimonas sp.]